MPLITPCSRMPGLFSKNLQPVFLSAARASPARAASQ